MVMAAMPAVHEKVHQRASEQKKKRQDAHHMRPMLGQQEERRNDEKSRQHPAGRAVQTAGLEGFIHYALMPSDYGPIAPRYTVTLRWTGKLQEPVIRIAVDDA